VSSLVEQEVARYLSSPRNSDDVNLSLLEWWKKHEDSYQQLSILAKKYLAIPASSVPSERVFSQRIKVTPLAKSHFLGLRKTTATTNRLLIGATVLPFRRLTDDSFNRKKAGRG
jgi:hypothetical protein